MSSNLKKSKHNTIHSTLSSTFGINLSKKKKILSLIGVSSVYKQKVASEMKSNLAKVLKHNFLYNKLKIEKNNRLVIRYLSSILSFKSFYFK